MRPNYFSDETAARRYARSRPYFHPLVIERISKRLPGGAVERALDVACGTGQSALALTQTARQVVGTDISIEMLRVAPPSDRINYVASDAESLPFDSRAFDLVTVALAFHWFRRERFLAEASRVLKPGGWLVVYNDWHTGTMNENPAFEKWITGPYISRYPSPQRDRRPLSAEEVAGYGFQYVERERIENEVRFSVDELVDYLTTQTNIIAAVEKGGESLSDVRAWLVDSVRPLFTGESGTFIFGGAIDYIRKQE